jgi:hypothetical protein
MRSSEGVRLASRLLVLFAQLQVAMVLGASVCYVLGPLISGSAGFAAAYHPGTYLFAVGDVLFLTLPVVGWMLLRGHNRRYSLEIWLAMLGPVAIITLVGELAGYPYLLWLVTGMYPAMTLGMLLCMLYRREQLTAPVDVTGFQPS